MGNPHHKMDLRSLLAPKSIAVVGASEHPGPGRQVLENLEQLEYQGDIYPVNPKYREVASQVCYPSLRDVAAFMGVLTSCKPRREVLKGDLDDAIFAADFGNLIAGKAPPVYGDPAAFFQNTYPASPITPLGILYRTV